MSPFRKQATEYEVLDVEPTSTSVEMRLHPVLPVELTIGVVAIKSPSESNTVPMH